MILSLFCPCILKQLPAICVVHSCNFFRSATDHSTFRRLEFLLMIHFRSTVKPHRVYTWFPIETTGCRVSDQVIHPKSFRWSDVACFLRNDIAFSIC